MVPYGRAGVRTVTTLFTEPGLGVGRTGDGGRSLAKRLVVHVAEPLFAHASTAATTVIPGWLARSEQSTQCFLLMPVTLLPTERVGGASYRCGSLDS